jgi:hypothetical protein
MPVSSSGASWAHEGKKMFDTTYINEGPSHSYSKVEITEKRAPTDESVRLLKEMERAAADKIVESVRVADSGFECVIHTHVDHLMGITKLMAIFSLNGKRMTAQYDANPLNDTTETAAIGLCDAVAREIANQILPAFIKANVQVR